MVPGNSTQVTVEHAQEAGRKWSSRSALVICIASHILDMVWNIRNNVGAIVFGLYSLQSRRHTMHLALDTCLETSADAAVAVVQESDPSAYSVNLACIQVFRSLRCPTFALATSPPWSSVFLTFFERRSC